MLYHLVREPKSATDNPPLLLLLHGYGSDEQDLFSFSEELPDDYFVISLRAIYPCEMGFSWYDIDLANPEKRINIEQAENSQKEILNFIDEAQKKYHFSNDFNLCAFSQGSILSFSLALNNPDKFQKVSCLSGYPEIKLLENVNMGSDFSNLEFFFSHGTQDMVIPIEWARSFKPIAEELQLDYDYKEYEQGHGINHENYYDMLNFLNKF